MYNKFFLAGDIETSVIIRNQCVGAVQVLCQIPLVILWPVNPSNHVGNDQVPLLGFDPVIVCKIQNFLCCFTICASLAMTSWSTRLLSCITLMLSVSARGEYPIREQFSNSLTVSSSNFSGA